jgi:hypothetical protein
MYLFKERDSKHWVEKNHDGESRRGGRALSVRLLRVYAATGPKIGQLQAFTNLVPWVRDGCN